MLHNTKLKNRLEILLVEDNPGDVRLMQNAIQEFENEIHLSVVKDGVDAINYLYKKDKYANVPTPDLIFLDLNLPKVDGRQVLLDIKNHPELRRIPVLVLTMSKAEEDVIQCYNLHANCYITKPFKIDDFMKLLKLVKDFWFNVVTLPPKKELEKNG